MKLSNGVEWLLHCCVTLSQAQEPISAQRLADLHCVPPAYLAKHLQALCRVGVVLAAQGPVGGYSLARPSSEITALEVIDAVEGSGQFFRCTEIRSRGPLAVPREPCDRLCAIARAMSKAEQAWRSALADVTIADLAAIIDYDSGGVALGNVRDWLHSR
jgi:Rrf2 family protein